MTRRTRRGTLRALASTRDDDSSDEEMAELERRAPADVRGGQEIEEAEHQAQAMEEERVAPAGPQATQSPIFMNPNSYEGPTSPFQSVLLNRPAPSQPPTNHPPTPFLAPPLETPTQRLLRLRREEEEAERILVDTRRRLQAEGDALAVTQAWMQDLPQRHQGTAQPALTVPVARQYGLPEEANARRLQLLWQQEEDNQVAVELSRRATQRAQQEVEIANALAGIGPNVNILARPRGQPGVSTEIGVGTPRASPEAQRQQGQGSTDPSPPTAGARQRTQQGVQATPTVQFQDLRPSMQARLHAAPQPTTRELQLAPNSITPALLQSFVRALALFDNGQLGQHPAPTVTVPNSEEQGRRDVEARRAQPEGDAMIGERADARGLTRRRRRENDDSDASSSRSRPRQRSPEGRRQDGTRQGNEGRRRLSPLPEGREDRREERRSDRQDGDDRREERRTDRQGDDDRREERRSDRQGGDDRREDRRSDRQGGDDRREDRLSDCQGGVGNPTAVWATRTNEGTKTNKGKIVLPPRLLLEANASGPDVVGGTLGQQLKTWVVRMHFYLHDTDVPVENHGRTAAMFLAGRLAGHYSDAIYVKGHMTWDQLMTWLGVRYKELVPSLVDQQIAVQRYDFVKACAYRTPPFHKSTQLVDTLDEFSDLYGEAYPTELNRHAGMMKVFFGAMHADIAHPLVTHLKLRHGPDFTYPDIRAMMLDQFRTEFDTLVARERLNVPLTPTVRRTTAALVHPVGEGEQEEGRQEAVVGAMDAIFRAAPSQQRPEVHYQPQQGTSGGYRRDQHDQNRDNGRPADDSGRRSEGRQSVREEVRQDNQGRDARTQNRQRDAPPRASANFRFPNNDRYRDRQPAKMVGPAWHIRDKGNRARELPKDVPERFRTFRPTLKIPNGFWCAKHTKEAADRITEDKHCCLCGSHDHTVWRCNKTAEHFYEHGDFFFYPISVFDA